jgi:dienelactone hydrolase
MLVSCIDTSGGNFCFADFHFGNVGELLRCENHKNAKNTGMKKLATTLVLAFIATLAAGSELERDAASLAILKEFPVNKPALSFPVEASELGMFSNYNNGIFKPQGSGPFPAVVLSHSCGGVRVSETKPWVEAGLKLGYVVLVIDSMRGNKNNCFPPTPINNSTRISDMLDALEHLSKMPIVQPTKIGAIGFSQGSMINAMLASKSTVEAVKPNAKRFAATVGLYGVCQWPKGTYKSRPDLSLSYVMQDTDKPLLYLMAKDDQETPASTCESELPALKAKGAPVEWHLYEGATHCWDCNSLNGFTKTDFKGERIIYRFDQAVTDDSIQRAYRFLGQRM